MSFAGIALVAMLTAAVAAAVLIAATGRTAWMCSLPEHRGKPHRAPLWQPERQARKIDGKDTSVTGQAACRNATVIDFSAPTAHRQPKAEPAAIRAPLFERPEQLVDHSVGKSATLVFHVDQHTVGGRTAAQGDVGPWPRELEGVLKQVRDDGGQDWSVSINSR